MVCWIFRTFRRLTSVGPVLLGVWCRFRTRSIGRVHDLPKARAVHPSFAPFATRTSHHSPSSVDICSLDQAASSLLLCPQTRWRDLARQPNAWRLLGHVGKIPCIFAAIQPPRLRSGLTMVPIGNHGKFPRVQFSHEVPKSPVCAGTGASVRLLGQLPGTIRPLGMTPERPPGRFCGGRF